MDGRVTGYRVDDQSVDSMQLDGEVVLLSLLTHGYFGLNATGTDVWELVKAHPGISAGEIAAAVGLRYGQAPADIMADVGALLDDLVRQHLLTECPPSSVPAVPIERCDQSYLAPSLQVYGDLDTLILSGE